MMQRAAVLCRLAVPLVVLACSGPSIPEANKALRPLAVTSNADRAAYDLAEGAGDLLNGWCKAAVITRRKGDALADDDPILDGRAEAEIARLRQALDLAETAELVAVLSDLATAHEERLRAVVEGKKFAAKRYLRADRKVAELSFGLHRWRQHR
jgi:hypothetical protein